MKLHISLIFYLLDIQKSKYGLPNSKKSKCGDQVLCGNFIGVDERYHIACWKLYWLEHYFPILKQLTFHLMYCNN